MQGRATDIVYFPILWGYIRSPVYFIPPQFTTILFDNIPALFVLLSFSLYSTYAFIYCSLKPYSLTYKDNFESIFGTIVTCVFFDGKVKRGCQRLKFLLYN